jgi:hypothetical protein
MAQISLLVWSLRSRRLLMARVSRDECWRGCGKTRRFPLFCSCIEPYWHDKRCADLIGHFVPDAARRAASRFSANRGETQSVLTRLRRYPCSLQASCLSRRRIHRGLSIGKDTRGILNIPQRSCAVHRPGDGSGTPEYAIGRSLPKK